MSDDHPTFGSLFAGIGGIDLGLERAGWECRFQVEWDPFCQRVLAKHWPDVPRYGDITAVDWSGVERVDLLAGGFPCQPISVAGKQQAQDDERWLWPEFAQAIRVLRPSYVLVENVPNLLAINDGSAAREVEGDLAALGYDNQWDCIPASALGAPHERERVWIVAYADSDAVRLQPESQRGRSRQAVPGDARAMADAPSDGWAGGGDADARRDADPARGERLRLEPAGNGAGGRAGTLADADLINVEGIIWRRHDPTVGQEPGERSTGLRSGGRRFGRAPQSRVVRAPHGLPDWMDGHRWPAPPGPQFDWEPPRTVQGRLANRAPRVKALGNAVVPQVVEVIGTQLLASLRAVA